MKKFIISLSFCLLLSGLFAQSPAKYWVQFKDKDNSPYSIDRPEEFLSKAALLRRADCHIPVDERDLPVNKNYIDQVLALDSTARWLTSSKWLNGITIYSEDSNLLEKVRQLPFVEMAECTQEMDDQETDIDTLFFAGRKVDSFDDWNVNRTYTRDFVKCRTYDYGKAAHQIMMTNAHWLHRIGYRGEGMRVMVMDGGFSRVDTLHFFDILREDNRLYFVRNLVQRGKSPFTTASHGASVLSCIAAYSPGEMVGTAPLADIFLCQTEDGRAENLVEEDNWVAGLELADSLGCCVVNSSLGYTKFDDTTRVRSYADLNGQTSRASRAAQIAAAKGMLICNSAGNEGNNEWKHISCPADSKDILSVGAVDPNRNRAPFSSMGPTADGRIKPDVCAQGFFAVVGGQNGKTSLASGTSFASPIMAGMVTCLRQAFPSKTNFEIMEAVRLSASQASHPDTLLGYGIPDFLWAFNWLNNPWPETVHFSSFVTKNDTISFVVDAPLDSIADLFVGFDGKKQGQVLRLSYTENSDAAPSKILDKSKIVIIFPPLKKNRTYNQAVLTFRLGDEKYYYQLGQEL